MEVVMADTVVLVRLALVELIQDLLEVFLDLFREDHGVIFIKWDNRFIGFHHVLWEDKAPDSERQLLYKLDSLAVC